MEPDVKIPSDVPADPVPDGDLVDSPVPDIDGDADDSDDMDGEEIPE